MKPFLRPMIFALTVAAAFAMWWEFGRSNRDMNAAAEEGDTAAVRTMLRSGLPIETRGLHGRTPLIGAAALRREPVIDLLLEHGANVKAADDSGRTALIEACAGGLDHSVAALLANGADPNAADHDGLTPLMEAARGGYASTIALLLDKSANPDAADKDGMTALMYAVQTEHGAPAVGNLIATDGDVNLKNKNGQTALDLAIALHRSEAGNLLIPVSRVPEKAWYTGTDLMRAVYWGQTDLVGNLLSDDPARAGKKDAYGRTALMRVNDDTLPLADLILNAGARINDTDNDGNTALIYAALRKQERFVHFLLEHGAEPDIKNKAGQTASDILGRPLQRVAR